MRHMLRATIIAMMLTTAACAADDPPSPPTLVVTPRTTPDNTPLPQHVSFAAGGVIDTGGQAGVVFVDPTTGAAEGWLLPGVPANYSFGLGASDGHLIFYRCQHPTGWPAQPGCEPPNAWYLFDTRTGDRARFEQFSDNSGPVIVWPEGDELLGVTADGPVLMSADHPGRFRKVDVPSGFQIFTSSAVWDRGGTHLLVSAYQDGTPQCGYSLGAYACGGGTRAWRALLIDRDTGAVKQLGESSSSSFAWSPDGTRFLLVRTFDRTDVGAAIEVHAADGTLIWSQKRAAIFSNASWSPDGASIAMQVLSKPERTADAMRLDVVDAATGDTRYRIVGAIACDGRIWTADSARLILEGAYGFERSVVADPRDGTLRALSAQVSPSLTDADIVYDGPRSVGTTATNIDSGGSRTVASFSSPMAPWTLSGSPLFGDRFAFVGTIPGGRDGCALAIEGGTPPTTHFEYPPFVD